MLNSADMQRLVDMQHRSFQLLKWVAQAVSRGFLRFQTAHSYTTLPAAAEGWIAGHYLNIPDNARPTQEELPAFCAFFSTYLTNSFDLISDPGRQLYSPGAHCFCPMCSWMRNSPHLKTKKLTSSDKKRADKMRLKACLGLVAEHRLTIRESEIPKLFRTREVFEDVSLLAYGYDLLEREKGIANGPAVLALWRGFAWNESGSPKHRFRLKAKLLLDAEERMLGLLGS